MDLVGVFESVNPVYSRWCWTPGGVYEINKQSIAFELFITD